jgi:hypothetical protein
MPRTINYDKFRIVTKEYLTEEYIKKGVPLTIIANRFGLDGSATFYKYVSSLGIPILIHRVKKDLTGQIFNKLKVLEIFIDYNTKITKERTKWKCLCLQCGNEVILSRSNVKKQLSCGCLNPNKKTGTQNPNWKGYKNVPQDYFTNMRKSAIYRNLEFNITIQDVANLFEKQNGLCSLTRLPIQFSETNKNLQDSNKTASVDRIDSSKGYTIDNIQLLHRDVNQIKMYYDQDYFIKLCKLVAINN